MLVYFPVKDDKGWNVIMIPSEQLVLIMGTRVIQKMPGRKGYVTERYYELPYMFKTSEAAWRFIRNQPTSEDDVYSKVEIWPDKSWCGHHLSKRDKRIQEQMRERKNYDNDKD